MALVIIYAILSQFDFVAKFTVKNLNKDFTNTGRGGGHHFLKVFHKAEVFFKVWLPLLFVNYDFHRSWYAAPNHNSSWFGVSPQNIIICSHIVKIYDINLQQQKHEKNVLHSYILYLIYFGNVWKFMFCRDTPNLLEL